jgi:hypothetical protein
MLKGIQSSYGKDSNKHHEKLVRLLLALTTRWATLMGAITIRALKNL